MRSSEEPAQSSQENSTVTFLFTDIEGSTKRWERHPEAMARAVARHDELMRTAITQHHGHVFKTVGDAFCAVFPNAEDAVAATVAAQLAIAQEDWGEVAPIRVRMGLHTGQAEERDADYFGPTVNRVARISSAGHGGQILLSSVTGEHVGERLPPAVEVRDLGKHRLKDLARPERLLQLLASGLPSDFPRLKTVPSPTPGIVAAALSTLVPLVLFRVGNRSSSEDVSASLLSPLSLYTGLKGLVIELSTLNEYLLIVLGMLLLLSAVGIAVARWRSVRRQRQRRKRDDQGRFGRWVVNQRTVAFLGVLALLVLGAYGYQQYLWRVALPIPDDALGIAMTREASAAIVQEQLADSLYTQGQAEQIIIRELPVVFDARDTDRARELGERIDAQAVIIYRTDDATDSGEREYIAYLVFTDPSIGLTITGEGPSGTGQSVMVKEGVPVPVLRTDSLEQLVNAAAGIIAYDADQPRKALEYLRLAVPPDPAAANTGIVNFYLGNAYNLDNQPERAAAAYEDAAAYYEKRINDGDILGPQDELVLAKTYMERGRSASFVGDWEAALAWYERGVGLRADLLARIDGLERSTDLHATYARLYTLMADAYRYMEQAEDQRSWEQRAYDEIDALAGLADSEDSYALVQQSTAYTFIGDCTQARAVLDQALAWEPTDIDALTNSGIIALLQDRPDLARSYWQRLIDAYPNNVLAREAIAQMLTLSGVHDMYFEPAYLIEAESYYREIISIDPANVFAHRALASLASLRAEAFTIDSTALAAGDDLSVAKSQRGWTLDPERRQAASDVRATVIDTYRLIASELQPDSPEAAVEVAESYLAREQLLYAALMDPALAGQDNPESAPLGEQILADAEQVHVWTDRVFDNADASRLDLIRAWAARVESLEREWGWYSFFAADEAKASETERLHRDAVAEAIEFIEKEPVSSIDEIGPMRIIYFKAMFIEGTLDQDTEAADAYMAKIQQLSMREFQERDEGISHYTTFCTEKREQTEASAMLERGDLTGARMHFEAALEANPEHIESLAGYGRALYRDGDLDGAISQVSKATQVAPEMPAPWIDLTLYHLAGGDTPSALTSLDRFLEVVAQRPAQECMHWLLQAIEQLDSLIEERPERMPEVTETLDPLSQALDDMTPEELGSYQYPQLYAELGQLALFADAASRAEPLFRRSLEIDPHQPVAQTDLVLALLAQDEDATAEMEVAIEEVADPYWSRVYDFENPERLRTMMDSEVSRYLEVFPQRASAVEPLVSAIQQADENPRESGTGVEGSVFTSATHGFTLAWDESWSVNEASTDALTGLDSLQVSNGTSTVQLSTGIPGENPAGCLQTVLGAIKGEPAWSSVVAALDPDGGSLTDADERVSYAAFVDRSGSDEAEAALVYFIQCVALPNSDTFVLAFIIVPVSAYDGQRDTVNDLLSTFQPADWGDEPGDNPIALPIIDLEAR
jgi:class 3 adenylate cyclase/tetratricopeptide (TPR) repeat protein